MPSPAREAAISSYHITLDVFEGPLDLLLRLIEREELDITRISLARVADQYLAYLATLRELTAANLADFVVVAAKLLVIKSRALLPPAEDAPPEEEEEDVGEALARQLQEYKRFKAAASQLREIEANGQRAYPRIAPPPTAEKRLRPGDVTLAELLDALKRALAAHPPLPAVDSVVAPVTVHITDRIALIGRLLRRQTRLPFGLLLRHARSRVEVIITFMAVLEMIKQQRLQATQTEAFGEIILEARQPDPPDPLAPSANLNAYEQV